MPCNLYNFPVIRIISPLKCSLQQCPVTPSTPHWISSIQRGNKWQWYSFSHVLTIFTLCICTPWQHFMAPAWESRKWILIGTWYVWWLCYVEQRYLLWAATTLGAEQTLSWMGHLGECKVRIIYLLPHSNLSMKSIIRSFWHQDQECQTLAILFIGGLDLEFLFNQNLKFHLALMKLQDGSGIQTASSLFSMASVNSEKSWFTCFASQEMFGLT